MHHPTRVCTPPPRTRVWVCVYGFDVRMSVAYVLAWPSVGQQQDEAPFARMNNHDPSKGVHYLVLAALNGSREDR